MSSSSPVRSFVRGAWSLGAAFLLASLGGCACGAPAETVDGGFVDGGFVDGGTVDAGELRPSLDGGLAVSFGPDVLPAVRARLEAHLRAVEPSLVLVDPSADPILAGGARHLCFGQTAPAQRLGAIAEANALKTTDALVVRVEQTSGGARAVALGAPGDARGTSYAAYALLEQLGFSFLHPLAPRRPTALTIPAALHLAEAPRWARRYLHLHTQHPFELTELLQGWGPGGPDDAQGFAAGLPEWDTYLEWLLANRQSGVEWFLLWADSWKTFADSDERQARLKQLVEHGHALGLEIGLDVPIVFAQQHAFRLLRTQRPSDEASELAELRGRVDWVLAAGFDWLGTESGTSEFTAPDPQRMLDWMNEVANEAARKGARTYVKVHVSGGQTAAGFVDPQTKGPLNFNFLPHYAVPSLGVLPHTVQAYGLTDPAPLYGNTSFAEIERFIGFEAGHRSMLFYPESAYWVSADIDTPLFLPIYAQRRLADLRRLAAKEEAGTLGDAPGARLDGQLVFSSGWEWGYWLNDVVAARAAWNPSLELTDALAFQRALEPALAHFGAAAPQVGQWLADLVSAQEQLLIFGAVGGVRPQAIAQRNGFGYLEAWDTWDDVGKLTGLASTQPDRIGLVELRNPLRSGPNYRKEVAPLLVELASTFDALATRGEGLRAQLPADPIAKELFDELTDGARITALRAAQIQGLYRYVDGYLDLDQGPRLMALASARAALDQAALVVARREAAYRVAPARLTAWSSGATAYAYRGLWMAHSLYGWWRDEGKAVDVPLLPCYLNVINPVDVAIGEGLGTDAVRWLGTFLSTDQQRGCFAEPAAEPTYPQDGLRTRP